MSDNGLILFIIINDMQEERIVTFFSPSFPCDTMGDGRQTNRILLDCLCGLCRHDGKLEIRAL